MFDGLVAPVETVLTFVAVPVRTLKLLYSLYCAHDVAVVAASQHF